MVIGARKVETELGFVAMINRVLARSEDALVAVQGLTVDRGVSTALLGVAWTSALETRLPGPSMFGRLGPFLPPAAKADQDVLKVGYELGDGQWHTNLEDHRLASARMQWSGYCQVSLRLPELPRSGLRIAVEWKIGQIKPQIAVITLE